MEAGKISGNNLKGGGRQIKTEVWGFSRFTGLSERFGRFGPYPADTLLAAVFHGSSDSSSTSVSKSSGGCRSRLLLHRLNMRCLNHCATAAALVVLPAVADSFRTPGAGRMRESVAGWNPAITTGQTRASDDLPGTRRTPFRMQGGIDDGARECSSQKTVGVPFLLLFTRETATTTAGQALTLART